jgi:H+/Cl- antiporter ClcA
VNGELAARCCLPNFDIPAGLPYYLLLGVVCGFAAVGFTELLYLVEDQFDRLPIEELATRQ